MPIRKVLLATGYYYHVYNRGVARQPIFFGKRDYDRILLTLRYYRLWKLPMKLSYYLKIPSNDRERWLSEQEEILKKLVEINCFVLMPNHFHLLLKQTSDGGITTFLRHATNSYTKFINTKYNRVGPLFQGEFKAVRIETDEQLLHVSRYIHLNPLISFIVEKDNLTSYSWSSFPTYLGLSSLSFLSPSIILDQFSLKESYKRFVIDHADYAKTLKLIKHLTIEKNGLR